MARPSKRLALFLCLIVLHQDIIQARSSYNEHLVMSARAMHGFHAEVHDDDVEEFGNTIQEVEARHNITLRGAIGRPLSRGKRFFGLFLFIVSMIVTVVATVVETVYDIAGCCGLSFHYLCGFEANFNRKKQDVQRRSEQVDKDLEAVLKKKEVLQQFGKVLENLWKGINNLVKLEERLLGSIDAAIKNALLAKEKEVNDLVRNAKGDLENMVEVSFQKLGEVQIAVQLSLSWGTLAIEGASGIAGKAYKSYKVNKAYKAMKSTELEKLLKASPKTKKLLGYTDDTAKVFLKQTALAKYAGKAKSVLKGLKFFKAAGAVLSILSIAFDLFNIINTFVQCKKKSDKAREACGKVEDAERKVQETENNVNTFRDTLRNGLEAQLSTQLKDQEMIDALNNIKETIESNPPPNNGQPPSAWQANCIQIIPQYINAFKSSGSRNWEDLKNKMQEIVDNCIGKQEYAYKCLIARNTMKEKISKGCKNGDKTFDELYNSAQSSEGTTIEQCMAKNEPYTTKEMFKKDLEQQSKVQGLEFFTDNCRMNNVLLQNTVCEGGSAEGLTEDQKATIQTDKCGGQAVKLSAAVISDICLYKGIPLTAAVIKGFVSAKAPDITEEDIEGVTCPQ